MKSKYCRGCGSSRLLLIYDFGPQPLAGVFPLNKQASEAVDKYPLDLTSCTQCGLMQVTNLPPIKEVFHDDYRYSSSTIPSLLKHFDEYKNWIKTYVPDIEKVFEFGCNDGVLLNILQKEGYVCKGIDASNNVAQLARNKGLDVTTGFFTPDYVVDNSEQNSFDLVTCSNVFAHIDDLSTVIQAVHLILKPGGHFSIEVHDGELLLSELQFDTIYHEHLTYFTEKTLKTVLQKNGFEFVRCEKTDMHGGGLRFLCKKSAMKNNLKNISHDISGVVLEYPEKIKENIHRCHNQLNELYEKYGALYGYGAAGRSQMFINVTESASMFNCIYDDSSLRQGRFIAGTSLSIEKFNEEKGECCVILAWNYADDICERVRPYFNKVVTLLPEMKYWP